MNPSFVHLRLHTEFSLIDGLVRVKPLIKTVAELGMPAIAITDFTNLFSLVKFQKTAKGAGVKPIYGSDLLVKGLNSDAEPSLLCLIGQTLDGYKNLTEIISEGYLHGQEQGIPLVSRDIIREKSEGLILLSGGRQGDVGKALLSGDDAITTQLVEEWKEIFPDRYYIEIQRTNREINQILGA